MNTSNKQKSAGKANETSQQEKQGRSKIGRTNEIIRDFLMSSQRYAADAIRVLLIAVSRDTDIGKLSIEDKMVLNRYLIDGLYKGECGGVDDMKTYRQDKAAELMGAVGEYLDTRQQSIAVTKFLMKFSSDNAMAQQSMGFLIQRPADLKNDAAPAAAPTSVSANQQGQSNNGTQGTQYAQSNTYQNGSK